MPKRKCAFNDNLASEFPFMKIKKTDDPSTVRCDVCETDLYIGHGGRSDINDHIKTAKHRNAMSDRASSSTITSYFGNHKCGDKELKLAAKEGAMAYHGVYHNHSFRSQDCTSKLMKTMFDKSYSSAREKSRCIVNNVLSSLAMKELEEELKGTSYVSIAFDTSNHKDKKFLPVLVRYFSRSGGIKGKILDFVSIEGETSTLLSERLQTVAENHNISEKIVCLTADNTNTNFGGAERRGPNNVFKKLQNSLGRNIVGVGCTAHVIHNCIEHACEALPVDVEAVVNKIYSYFFRYTVRVTELKQFCDFVETEYRKVKGYAATRWLSLMPSIQRILEIYNALKSYFQSQDKCPVILKSFFEDPMGEVWLWFVHNQSCLFETTIKEIEGEGVSASEAAVKFMNLKEALENRKASVFLPWKVKELLRTQENSEIITSDFKKLANVFYTECVTYLEKWEKGYQDMMLLRWTLLETELLQWEDVESSFQFVQPILGVGLSIDNDSLFDEFCYLTKLVTKEKIGEWQNRKCDVATKWIEVFRTFEEKNVPCKNLSRMVEFSLCLPGTNAPVERVFSLINNLWTSEKTQLGVNTLKSILICQVNFEETCCEMYTKLSKNVDVLKKIHASEKYRSQNDAATATATCENP